MINRQVIRKLALAKRMERDALMDVIPQRERAHLAVISREVHAMVRENYSMNPADVAEVLAMFMEVRDIFSEDSPVCGSTPSENKTGTASTDNGKSGVEQSDGSGHTRKVDIS